MAGCSRDPSTISRDATRQVANAEVLPVTDETFAQEVLEHPNPVVVVMGTKWCPKCIEIKPSLTRLANELEGRVRFREVDVESNLFLSEKYAITQYPTLLIFLHGEEQERHVADSELSNLKQRLNQILASAP